MIVLLACCVSFDTADATEPARFELDVPTTIIRGTRTEFLRWTAYRADGTVAEDFNETLTVRGARLLENGGQQNRGTFQNGVLEWRTDPVSGTRVYIDADELELRDGSRVLATKTVRRVHGWLTLLPPLLAVLLAIWWRDAVSALAVGVAAGALVLYQWRPMAAAEYAVGELLLHQLVPPDGDTFHITVILFTACLGGMVHIMFRSGGLDAFVTWLAKRVKTRRGGMLAASTMGLIVFFDDYANTFLVGTALRPLTDRLKISREKLAFLVDATAAPVAGLAIVSTWVGVEVSYIQESYQDLGLSGEGYSVLIQTLPYRFYPLFALLIVFLISWSGRDFGAMYRAERRTIQDQSQGILETAEAAWANQRGGLILALIPLTVLIVGLTAGLWLQGLIGLDAANEARSAAGEPLLPANMLNLIAHAQADRVLLYASLAAGVLGGIACVITKTMSIHHVTTVWLEGVERMIPPMAVLLLAWCLSAVCDSEHLATANYLVEISANWMTVNWLPATAFVLSAAVSFATGSSWSTMGILIPLVIAVANGLLQSLGSAAGTDPLMLATIGAVLAGSIFGDHCSPISDTTVLSSAACDCDHVAHVRTQMPYALVVGGISLLCGYVPVGFGWPAWLGLLLGSAIVAIVVFRIGRIPGATGSSR